MAWQRSWAAEESAAAIQLYKDGKSPAQIAEVLRGLGYGRSTNQVYTFVFRKLPEERRKRGTARHRQFVARRDEVLRLGRLGMNARQIEQTTGLPAHYVYHKSTRVDRAFSSQRFEKWLKTVRPWRRVPPDLVVSDENFSIGYNFIDLPETSCHWPIGVSKTGSHQFCGVAVKSRVRSNPYCEQHRKLAVKQASVAA